MFWIVAIIIALVSFKLGVLVITVKLLATALQLAVLVLLGWGIHFAWKRFRESRSRNDAGRFQKRIISNRGE